MKSTTAMTVPAFLLPALLKTGLDFDVDAISVLKKHGIDLQTIAMDSGRIPAELFDSVLDDLVDLTQNSTLGLSYSHHFSYDYIPEMESFLLSASTMREAMLAYRWMAQLFDNIVKVEYIDDESFFTVKLLYLPDTPQWVARLFAESSFTLVSRMAAQKAGPDFRIKRLNFANNDKRAVPVYQNAFRCPIHVGQDHYSITFSNADVDKPLEQHSPSLKALSRFQIEQRIASLLGDKSLAEALRELLMQNPFLMAKGINDCASHLYMTPRTLQRKLQAENTSFREELDRVRETLATQYLKGSAPLEQISDLLCFSDRRSFTRAFKKWRGMSPSQYRKALRK